MRGRTFLVFVVLAACTVRGRLPRPGDVGISMRANVRVDARVAAPPPPPPPVVAIVDAPVPEFFGIPLEGVQDVVFVLDCSGSMADPAIGQLAQIPVSTTPPPSSTAPTGPPPPPSSTAPTGPPPPPSSTAPTGPPPPPPAWNPNPNQPPADQPPPPGDASTPEPPPQHPSPPVRRKIDVAQSELVDALARLPAGTRMNVIFFNSGVEGFSPAIVALEEAARAGLITFIRSTEPSGSTALAPAMRTAFLMNAKRVVLLSDGLGNVGGNAAAVLRDAREAMYGGVRIDTIGLGHSQDANLLRSLAGESGGLYQAL